MFRTMAPIWAKRSMMAMSRGAEQCAAVVADAAEHDHDPDIEREIDDEIVGVDEAGVQREEHTADGRNQRANRHDLGARQRYAFAQTARHIFVFAQAFQHAPKGRANEALAVEVGEQAPAPAPAA